jgi:hypothetical protein
MKINEPGITEAALRRILADIQEQQRRIIREELALALSQYAPKGASVTTSTVPTPALDTVREMSQRERMEAIARSPNPAATARELFKHSRPRPRTKKAAA